MLLNMSFYLLLIVEGCIGPTDGGKVCLGQNFSLRVPFETLEQCEWGRRRVLTPGGFQKYVKAVCLALPKDPTDPS